jgi:phage terminase small subunit
MLTLKQEEFAKKIVEGMNQADAYRSTYSASKMSDNAVYREASLLAANPKVAQRVKELREELSKDTIMTAQERLQWLSGLIQSDEVSISDKLKASDQMNKMQGEYVQRFSGDVNMNKLEDLL